MTAITIAIGIGVGITSAVAGDYRLAAISNQLSTISGSAIFAPWQQDTLFQDAAGTTPVTDFGQPVGLMLDVARWGGKTLDQMLEQEATSDPLDLPGYHATFILPITRPIYQQDSGGRPYLASDGVNDGMVTPSIDLSAYDKIGVFAGVRKLSDAAAGIVAELGASVNSVNASFRIAAPLGASPSYDFVSRGTVLAQAFVNNVVYAAPHSAVLSGLGDISGDRATLRVNGTQVVQATTDQGTGNYGNYPLYLFRRGGTSLPFNGRFYGYIQHPGTPSADFIAQAEALLADKTGVTL